MNRRISLQWMNRMLVASLLGIALVSPIAAQGKSSRVAVVDIDAVLKQLDEIDFITAEFEDKLAEVDRENNDRIKEIKEIENELSLLQPDTDDYKKRLDEYELKAIGRNQWLEYRKQKLEREAALQWEALYRKIISGIERLAKREGIDLVIQKDDVSVRGKTQQEVKAKITMRKLLYVAGELDITDQLAQLLNNEFNNSRRKPQ